MLQPASPAFAMIIGFDTAVTIRGGNQNVLRNIKKTGYVAHSIAGFLALPLYSLASLPFIAGFSQAFAK